MREKLFATLEEKRRKLKDDKDNCDLVYGKPGGPLLFSNDLLIALV